MVGDIYNTTINVNGNRVFSSTFRPGNCCCYRGGGMFMANSCFGFGYGGFGTGIGMGLGYAAGMSLAPALPSIFKGIGSAFKWVGTKVIAPAATFAWNKGIKPVGKAIWNGVKWLGNTVSKGISKLWNGIFHKKSKSKAEKSE